MAEKITCPSCGQMIDKIFYEKWHKYSCLVARSLEEADLPRWGAVPEKPKELVSEAEIQKEMREHAWADRQIAEQIARDHRKLGAGMSAATNLKELSEEIVALLNRINLKMLPLDKKEEETLRAVKVKLMEASTLCIYGADRVAFDVNNRRRIYLK